MTAHEVPAGVELSTEPDDGGQGAYVHVSVVAGDQNHTASAYLDAEPDDERIADELLKVALAAAQMHSSGAWMALQRRLS